MKICVDKIPEGGMEIQERIEPGGISLDSASQGLNLTKSIDAKARISRSGDQVFVDMRLESSVEYTCSRCLTKIQDVVKKEFKLDYEVKPGDILEIDEDIRQEIILDYPMKVVCKPDCMGLCPNCGQNLNIDGCECK